MLAVAGVVTRVIAVRHGRNLPEHPLGVLVAEPRPPGAEVQRHLPDRAQLRRLGERVVPTLTDESVVVGVQHGREQDGELTVLGEVLDARDTLLVQRLRAPHLVADGGGDVLVELELQQLFVRHVVLGERLPWKINPVAFHDVLVHVPDEVGELERLTQRGRVRQRGLWIVRVHHGGHHPPDGRGRPVHVLLQLGVRLVPIRVDVRLHRVHEHVHVRRRDPVAVTHLTERL